MQLDWVLVGGEVVADGKWERADIGISGGKIAIIGDLSRATAQNSLNCKGLSVFPGFIDTQVHFREPGMEHKECIESGTRSAVLGGVTTVLEMPNTIPPTTSAEALAQKVEISRRHAWCRIGFFVGACKENLDQLAELEILPGTPGIKLFMGSSTGSLLVGDDDSVRKVLLNGRKRVPVHSEDAARLEERKKLIHSMTTVTDHPYLRDAECARLCTQRLLALAKETRRPIHVLHLSTLDELPLIESARREGVDVTTEVTPQHLWFAAPDCYEKLGTLAQMNPPIRSEEHRAALRESLRRGFFTVFGSDHAPHTLEEKSQPYPNSPSGMPGVQTLFSALWTLNERLHLVDLATFVAMLCERPAELYGMKGKGRVAVGFDADLAIVDRKARYVFERSMVESRCGWSPFEGEEFLGKVVDTMVGGELVVRDGKLEEFRPGWVLEFENDA